MQLLVVTLLVITCAQQVPTADVIVSSDGGTVHTQPPATTAAPSTSWDVGGPIVYVTAGTALGCTLLFLIWRRLKRNAQVSAEQDGMYKEIGHLHT
ncbi:hypothetical protein AaE_001770 [Aphanomyces astaci]|uniref:Uncharacterized protein n=1 Tax=Aphanomyces astaci TaxID=112090 RepID=A0A6A5AW81_APHAT|nr:hypothetical protein AaE_001770 [Aphanomyces astaci]